MRMNTILRYALLALLATLLINAHTLAMILLGWSSHTHTLGSHLLAMLRGSWCGSWLYAWKDVWASVPFLVPLQVAILLTGLIIWFWRPNLLTAALLALAAMYAGPAGHAAFVYLDFSLPIAAVILLPAFVLHISWRKPVPPWLKFYFDA